STASGAAAAANNLKYLGQYQTQRGALLFGYRYYQPDWGRFTQPDPTGQERNPYNYATCDPINNVDPTGAASSACKKAGAVAIVAILGTTATYVATAATAGVTAGLAVGTTNAFIGALAGVISACS
ncbi:RHS repeat-associated core domain-containing protein, partial [Kibdelosporangium sp. 4NS15]